MKVNGRMIKCMGSANFTMKMVKLHMKAIGIMMSSTVKVEFTILSLLSLINSSITKIFLSLETSGHTTKDNLKMIPSMVKVILNLQMVKCLKAYLTMI